MLTVDLCVSMLAFLNNYAILIVIHFNRGVAQPGSAPALGAGSRRFESYRPDSPNKTHPLAVSSKGFLMKGHLPASCGDPKRSQLDDHNTRFSLTSSGNEIFSVRGFMLDVDADDFLSLSS